ncbi:MAG: hypothetical protein EAY81_02930 [Bacteroidetes bacterium]|nr:MAG: hypothetical protein EAY81_02930 [Bacteroidota bacterium]
MNLNDAQQKMSVDIAQLYETYQLISKNKHQFNELDVALLQQQLLYVYRSLLQVQQALADLPKAAIIEEAVLPIADAIAPTLQTEQPVVVETPAAIEPVILEEEVVKKEESIAVKKEPTVVPASSGSLFDVDTPVSKLNNVTENEPTLDDLEKLLESSESNVAEISEPEEAAPKADLSAYSFLTVTETKAPEPEKIVHETSLLDKLAAVARTTEVIDKITREQQQSLKQAINLNKKIAFVNNLFNENTVEYAKAIEKLNSSGTVHEALRYFNELKHQYNWSNENALVKELEQLVEKRFS